MMISLLIAILLLLGVAFIVLDYVVKHAPEGFEDDSGFHQNGTPWSGGPKSTDAGISRWDQTQGASCSLDARPTLRPVIHTPFIPRQP